MAIGLLRFVCGGKALAHVRTIEAKDRASEGASGEDQSLITQQNRSTQTGGRGDGTKQVC